MTQQLVSGKTLIGRYTIQDKLGSGAYGTVYRVNDKKEQKEKAMKIVKIRKPRSYESYVDEITVLKELKGTPGVQQMEDVFEFKSMRCIISILYLADLENLKRNNKDRANRFLPATTMKVGYHIVKSIQAIHERGFLHRDLKLGNVMVPYDQKDSKLIVVDYGMCCRYKTSAAANARRIKVHARDYAFDLSPYHSLRMSRLESAQESEDMEMICYCLMDCRGLNLFGGLATEMIAQKEKFAANPSSYLRRKDKFLSELIELLIDQPYGETPHYSQIYKKITDWKYHGDSIDPTADLHIEQYENGKFFME